MRFTRAAATAVACAAVFIGLTASPSSATTSHFYFLGNNGTTGGYSQGHIVFYNRTVQISGSVKSNTTGCVQAEFWVTINGGGNVERRTACGRGVGSSKDFGFTSEAVVGGWEAVTIYLDAVTADGVPLERLDSQTYYR
jgi:hypothetical protein